MRSFFVSRIFRGTCFAIFAIIATTNQSHAKTSKQIDFLLEERLCRSCDLSGLDMSGLDLTGVNLIDATLTNANLSGSNLTGADLTGANLQGANLQYAVLDSVNLTNTDLSAADLEQATFDHAKFNNTNFNGTRLAASSSRLARQIDFSKSPISAPTPQPALFPQYIASSSLISEANVLPGRQYSQSGTFEDKSSFSPDRQTPSPKSSPDSNSFIGGADVNISKSTPLQPAGIGFIDGSTVPDNQFLISQYGGEQGFLSSLRYGILDDLEVFGYIDQITSDVDESIQGLGVKYQISNQDRGGPLTAAVAVNVGSTNKAFLNFANNDRNALETQGLDAGIAFLGNGQNSAVGQNLIVGIATPIHFQIDERVNVWLTPMASYVVNRGFEQAGLNVGASFKVHSNVELVAEAGANFLGDGNSFVGNSLSNEIPWNGGIRLNSANLKGFGDEATDPLLILDLYVTNRVGNSPWNQLRVRDKNKMAFGAGLSFQY